MDTNKHKFLMMQILKDIFTDSLLSSCMAFKGDTSSQRCEIKATIDNKEYAAKQISASDKQLYCGLNLEQKKAGFAKILAKKYFINEC